MKTDGRDELYLIGVFEVYRIIHEDGRAYIDIGDGSIPQINSKNRKDMVTPEERQRLSELYDKLIRK